ncbi:vitamin K epoxide reductase family protein [Patescibacteria group bacterium]
MIEKLVRPKVNKILYYASLFIFLNIAVSVLLAYEFYNPGAVGCSLNSVFDCMVVAQSKYAVLFGVPVAIWGALFYFGLLVGTLGVALRVPFNKIYKGLRPNTVLNITRYFTYFGLLFSFYLTYVEAFVLYVYCPYCIIQQVLVLIIVALHMWAHKLINQGLKETKVCEFC